MLCDVFVQLDNQGFASLAVSDIETGSSDNCGIVSKVISPSTFDCSNAGPNQVTLTVTDAGQNTSTCVGTVTVLDGIVPTVVCQSITLQLDASGQASLVASDIDAGSSDNCVLASLSASPSAFSCARWPPERSRSSRSLSSTRC